MLYSTNTQDDSVTLSKTTTTTNDPPNKQKEGLSCQHCSQIFASRNLLFRHLKKDSKCSLLAASGTNMALTRQSIALLFGYSDNDTLMERSSSTITGSVEKLQDSDRSQATQARMILSNATLRAVEHVTEKNFNMTRNSSLNSNVQLISATQSSSASMRHRSVAQEAGCAAAGDVFCANLLAPELMNTDLWLQVLERIQEELLAGTNNTIQVERMKIMEQSDIKLHAERGCTQRIYHYLLPLSWLPDGDKIHEWWKSGDELVQTNKSMKKAQKAPESLRRFKAALRSAESSVKVVVVNDVDAAVDDQNFKTASGRFGSLGKRERRPWHNYADPELRGDASPSTEPVFRVVDRARIVDFLMNDDGPSGGEAVAVLEFKGDAFLRQQVLHIVGAAVAITHEWLPDDFVDKSTRADTVVETPIAPPGRLYNAGSRFHFAEMRTKGRPLFDSNLGGSVITGSQSVNGIEWIQQLLLDNKAKDEGAATSEKMWLDDLKTIVAPRIQTQLASAQDDPPEPLSADQVGNYPKSYGSVLTELRNIIISDRWPETSAARSTVIRHVERTGEIRKNGSFTVVNPAALNDDTSGLPLGNELFPELAQAIFDLEEDLSKETRDRVTVESLEHGILVDRAPSSHCAVNCNAEFTPHVDSGKGAGQSLSMIVGLGDYAGGELFVEGRMFDIRYKPIEFDGWKLRHWTNRFNGERFSLVWFTPETKSKK
jgi:tRNA U38,U39,U40 pseudouridine synthase TruA